MFGLFKRFAAALVLIAFLATPCFADRIGILASEGDGNPLNTYAYAITFPNGTISIVNGVLTYTPVAGAGDVTGSGDCASGACGDGTSDGGTYYRLYDGTANYLQLAVSGALGGDLTLNLDTLLSTGSPQFTAIELGHATDTTIARSGAGAITVEGTAVLLSGGDAGTPSALVGTNVTGVPISTGISGLGAGVAAALANAPDAAGGLQSVLAEGAFVAGDKTDHDTMVGSGAQAVGSGDSPTFAGPNFTSLEGDQVTAVTADTQNIADSGDGNPASATIDQFTNDQSFSSVELTCSDADGCSIDVSEVSATRTQMIVLVNTSANAITVADSAGVNETSQTWTLGQYETLTFVRISDRWVEQGGASNALSIASLNMGGGTFEMPNGTSGTTNTTGQIYLDTNGDGGTNFSGPVVQLSTNGATLGYLFPIAALPQAATEDNYIIKYDATAKTVSWEADSTGSGSLGSNLSSTTNDIASDTGIIQLNGTGNTNNEDLDWDFETVANEVGVSSDTGVDNINFGAIRIETTGDVTGGALTTSKAASYTLGTDDPRESYGGTVYVTGAATITLPAVADGMWAVVHTVGAVAVSVDTNVSDLMYLDGTALDDGDKATNTSTTGDTLMCKYYSADGWWCMSGSPDGDHWTDGGP